MNVADALRREEYNDGEQIIQQVCGCMVFRCSNAIESVLSALGR